MDWWEELENGLSKRGHKEAGGMEAYAVSIQQLNACTHLFFCFLGHLLSLVSFRSATIYIQDVYMSDSSGHHPY